MTISALIIARDEEKKIEECLSSLNFADEIELGIKEITVLPGRDRGTMP